MIERIKSTSFWAGLIGAVFLILGAFGMEIGDEVASTVINGVCSVLIMLGIASPTVKSKNSSDGKDENVLPPPEKDDE
ncbi:MAG: phage holin family protein [Clostridiales bacterium]|nr:phage holin family protein [Clostridiales bacterium]